MPFPEKLKNAKTASIAARGSLDILVDRWRVLRLKGGSPGRVILRQLKTALTYYLNSDRPGSGLVI